mgnify:FL=1
MQDENSKWKSIALASVCSLPILAVVTGHPFGYAVCIIWGWMGWILMAEAFSDYKKMKERVEELEKQKGKR